MKKMKLLSIAVLTVLLMGVTSCKDDNGYSLDKYWVSLATIRTNGLSGADAYYIELDNGKKLWPAAQAFYYYPKNGQRVMANYTLLSDQQGGYDHYVRVNGLSDVLTKSIIDLRINNADSIGNDKVKIEDIWIGSRYVNIIFGYNAGYTGTIHYINMVNNTTVPPFSPDTTYLEFRHNARGDVQTHRVKGIVSFNLQKASASGSGENIIYKIKVNGFNGEENYVLKLPRTGVSLESPELPQIQNLNLEPELIN